MVRGDCSVCNYPANSLKRNTQVILLPWRKKYEKSAVKYLNLEVIMWDQNENYDLDTCVSYKKDNALLKLTLQKKYLSNQLCIT